ncbi:pyridoxamine 5'-phosphate oxidase family protein [Streptomyces sp. NRRL F-5123]|uniref:pyridoxamine 5'-phosphate oxidase family protein n=1 Tax=Streptomyces sp. NRRL F-5123 TaxID=1463856 RepID=UPI000B1F1B08|nr:pyridoxamine 5'-phosphate oxidase family protein [Streptomyces sp. NRRL F-5123]
MTTPPFDVGAFLGRPLTARAATDRPTVRPVRFLWEESAFRVLTRPSTLLHRRVAPDPRIALVEVCDIATGVVRRAAARGRAEPAPFDVPRGRRESSATWRVQVAWARALRPLPARRPGPARHGVAAHDAVVADRA